MLEKYPALVINLCTLINSLDNLKLSLLWLLLSLIMNWLDFNWSGQKDLQW